MKRHLKSNNVIFYIQEVLIKKRPLWHLIYRVLLGESHSMNFTSYILFSFVEEFSYRLVLHIFPLSLVLQFFRTKGSSFTRDLEIKRDSNGTRDLGTERYRYVPFFCFYRITGLSILQTNLWTWTIPTFFWRGVLLWPYETKIDSHVTLSGTFFFLRVLKN